jgi:mannosyltransferase OCH1-like enzyme
MIPRLLHMIWVGDESRRPVRCIRSWQEHHPDWTFRLWGNAQLAERKWINGKHMKAMAGREWNGVADMMRWEILFDQGGVLVDADSFCIRPLPDWLLECEAFTCWENERVRPGLLAAGYFGSVARTPFLAALIEGIRAQPTVIDRMAWQSVGPQHLTDTWIRTQYDNLTILPSHFFIPRHFSGAEYQGGGPVYARQEWASTLGRYEELAGEGEPPAAAGSPDPSGPGPAAQTPAVPPAIRELPVVPGQAFLFEPDWQDAEWIEVVLGHLLAFEPDDPVALILVLDPARDGQVPLAQAEAAVREVVGRVGKARIPEVLLVDSAEDFAAQLRRFDRATWVPKGRGNGAGLRGELGSRLAQARKRLGSPAAQA